MEDDVGAMDARSNFTGAYSSWLTKVKGLGEAAQGVSDL